MLYHSKAARLLAILTPHPSCSDGSHTPASFLVHAMTVGAGAGEFHSLSLASTVFPGPTFLSTTALKPKFHEGDGTSIFFSGKVVW